MIDQNTKTTNGIHLERRFAYLKQTDHRIFGLLLASGSEDARRHLGGGFHIRQTWLTSDELKKEDDREGRWEVVASIFMNPLSEAFIGKRRASHDHLTADDCGPVQGPPETEWDSSPRKFRNYR